MSTARGENVDSKLYSFSDDEGFKKFQKLTFCHLLKGKIHLIVTDKLLIQLTACNSTGSQHEMTVFHPILSLNFINYCCYIVPEEEIYFDTTTFLLKLWGILFISSSCTFD